MSKLSLWQAIQMGGEHYSLVEASRVARSQDRQFMARDLASRAETIGSALARHGWRMLSGGLVVERIRKPGAAK